MVNTSVRNGTAIHKLRTNSYRVEFLPAVSKAASDYTTYIKVAVLMASKPKNAAALVYLELKCPNRMGDKGVKLC